MSSLLVLDLSATSAVYSLALNLIVISLFLCAFALGISHAFKLKRLWAWGVEELAQAIINASLLGVIIGFGVFATSMMDSFVDSASFSNCSYLSYSQNSPIAYSLCSIEQTQDKAWKISDSTLSQSYLLGALSSLELSFNVAHASPFNSLSHSAQAYNSWAQTLGVLLSSLELNRQFLLFVAKSGFSFFLPLGLLLRMFFATRKLGGAIMAGAISFFMLYPLLFFSFSVSDSNLQTAFDFAFNDLNNLSKTLEFVPTIDWAKEPDIAGLFDSLANTQLASLASAPFRSVPQFIGVLCMYSFSYPLFAFALCLVCAKELYGFLGSPLSIDIFSNV